MVSAVTLSLHKKMTAFVIISFSLTHKKLNFNYYCALVLCYLAICFLFVIWLYASCLLFCQVFLGGPDCVTVCTEQNLSPPPLVTMTLSLRTLPNTKTHQNEVMRARFAVIWYGIRIYHLFTVSY